MDIQMLCGDYTLEMTKRQVEIVSVDNFNAVNNEK